MPIDNKNLNKIIIIKPYILANSPWEEAAEVPGNKTKGTSPNITEGEEYEFRVIAVNKGGSGELSEPSKSVIAKPRFRKYLSDVGNLDRKFGMPDIYNKKDIDVLFVKVN